MAAMGVNVGRTATMCTRRCFSVVSALSGVRNPVRLTGMITNKFGATKFFPSMPRGSLSARQTRYCTSETNTAETSSLIQEAGDVHSPLPTSAEARLDALLTRMGLTSLPEPPAPGGLYKPVLEMGRSLYVSGHPPIGPDGVIKGVCKDDSDVASAKISAAHTALAVLASAKSHLGSLDRIHCVVKTFGMVNCEPGFSNHPQVIDGFSEVMAEVFGSDDGVGVRSAVGMVLPNGIATEVECVFNLHKLPQNDNATERDTRNTRDSRDPAIQAAVSDGSAVRLFVGGVSFASTKESLAEVVVSLTGEDPLDVFLLSDRSGKPKGCGFVTVSADAADTLCKTMDAEHDGRTLRFDIGKQRGDSDNRHSGRNDRPRAQTGGYRAYDGENRRGSGGGGGFGRGRSNRDSGRGNREAHPPSTTIFVGQLPYSMRGDELLEIFDGAVEARVPQNTEGVGKGFGYVEFDSVEEATAAVENYDGAMF